MTHSPGTRLGGYEILSLLGAGGMGEVYRARDLRLGREVALKLLPPDLAVDPERRERFRHEARTLAALDHPNIVTVYSVEETAGQHYLTMALIDGETLDRLVPPDGLPVLRLIELAKSLADALATAHAKGIVHRDLKPGNIMLRADGRPVVLDFGLAKVAVAADGRGADDETIAQTRADVLVGTVPYMSPEQLQHQDLDGRSDLFSLGVVLYEMATGRRPFQGASAAALVSAILRDTPPPVAELRPELPGALGELIARCLEKSRDARIQTAGEVKAALEAIGAPASRPASPAAPGQSVAVLPFVNHSASADDAYFSDGITEEILGALTRIEGLRVAARTSSFAFKDATSDLKSIAATLRVRNVLEGSVRRSGDRLRITVQLVDVETGYPLWSERYDRELTDVFAIQDEIAAAIAAKLEVTLGGGGGKRTPRRRTSNLQAYDEYLRGLALQNRRGGSVYRAIACLDRAIALDPGYADAHALLSDAHRLLATYGYETPNTAMPRARAAAEVALGLDPDLPEAHATLADVAGQYERDSAAAFRSWERALTLQPEHTRARCERAFWGIYLGRIGTQEAVREARRAVDADPLNVWAISMYCLILGVTESAEEAVAMGRRALELDPESFLAHYVALQSLIWAGRFDEALAAGRDVLRMSGRHHWTLAAIGVAHAGAGDRVRAQAIYDELAARARSEYMQPFHLCYLACALDDAETAMAWALRGAEERDAMSIFSLGWPGVHAVLSAHPDHATLLKAIGR